MSLHENKFTKCKKARTQSNSSVLKNIMGMDRDLETVKLRAEW